jgi:hypothetical protein
MQTQAITTPRRRGRHRKTLPHFPGTVIRFDSRPRLVVGDVVELCRGCLPSNRGKLATIEAFQDDGRVLVRSMFLPLDTVDPDNGAQTGQEMTAALPPENLYRRSSSLKGH